MSCCSVLRVVRTYLDIRRFCRKYHNHKIKSLEEARLMHASFGLGEWELSPKEERLLRFLCKYLGL